MGYSKDLDEYTDHQLIEELDRRKDCRNQGLCDYCGSNSTQNPCRFPERHWATTRVYRALPPHERT